MALRFHSAVRKAQAGFSLLEVLVVVAILSAAAYVALDSVDHDTGQLRFDITERRLEAIRRGIVGEPGLSVNGTPVVSGYVADVGQLPPCLFALLVQSADCNGDGTAEINPPAFANVGGLAFGWRGPYLEIQVNGFFDSWGNTGDSTTDYGWTVAATATTFNVSSLGRDRAAGGTADYDADRPMNAVNLADFTVNLAVTTITAEITETNGAARNVCLGLRVPDPNDESNWILVSGSPVVNVAANTTVTQGFSAAQAITMGARNFIIYDEDDATVSNCAVNAGQEAAFLTNGAILFSRSLMFVPRTTPSANIALTL
ncbi:MAG: prepilin-type N-terminal cleavage/methylation domain-containing protein [Pseudomonadota bacterium]